MENKKKEINSEPTEPTEAEVNQSNTARNKNKANKNSISRIMRYAAAVLSFISFLTTANGMGNVLGDDKKWQAYCISFGIQTIILVLGTKFFEIVKKIWNAKRKNGNETKENSIKIIEHSKFTIFEIYKIVVIVLMSILYICSIAFSTFFSYVFIANSAYDNVKSNDYNIEIEEFLVSETKHIKDINRAASNYILSEIQKNAEVLGNITSDLNTNASVDLKDIINNAKLEKNSATNIPNKKPFDSNAVLESYYIIEGREPIIQSYEAQITSAIGFYENSYATYNKIFEELLNLSDPIVANDRINRINSEISYLSDNINSLSGLRDSSSTVNSLLNNAVTYVNSYFNSLIKSYNELKYVYEDIANSNITEGININIDNLYETLYSTVDVEEEIIDKSISELKLIVKKYLKENKNGNDETIEKISKCIIYLGEFKKCREFEEKIELFEENALSQVYIIEIPTESTTKEKETDDNKEPTQEEKTSSLSESQAEEEKDTSTTVADDYMIEFHNITVDEWNKQRRKDLAQFINIIKTLPDIDLLLETMGDTDEESKSSLKEYNAELENTLTKAYKLNREKLEKINPVEQAAKYLSSDFDFMAKFSFLIALFMDIASFLIGIFLYFVNDKKDDEEDKDVSVQKT